MLFLQEKIRGGHNLAQGDPAVTGRNALMPVWRKTFVGQAPNRASRDANRKRRLAARFHTAEADLVSPVTRTRRNNNIISGFPRGSDRHCLPCNLLE
jgi:hypothetical protein